jgi:hypothetical protein
MASMSSMSETYDRAAAFLNAAIPEPEHDTAAMLVSEWRRAAVILERSATGDRYKRGMIVSLRDCANYLESVLEAGAHP